MSLDDTEMAFPRFLLVDTPETAGIDKANLIACIEMIQTTLGESEAALGQVILTTGPNRLPDTLDDNVFLTIEMDAHLLNATSSQ